MASKSGKVGFVGGMDIPLIRKFECGYEQGARSVKADIEVFQNMTGTTGAAWNDPVRGGELTKNQIDQALTSFMRQPVPPVSAFCRPLPTTRSCRSASIPTRTICIRARS